MCIYIIYLFETIVSKAWPPSSVFYKYRYQVDFKISGGSLNFQIIIRYFKYVYKKHLFVLKSILVLVQSSLGRRNIILINLTLNLKNNENDAVFDEICKKKKAKMKIKFQKMKGTFLDSIPWLKSHQPLLYM